MKNLTCVGFFVFAILSLLIGTQTARADDADSSATTTSSPVPTLSDVHQTLLQAAGYQTDTPPTVDDEKALLEKAQKMIIQIPHVYHGELVAASRDINAALSELASGDKANKAREDIFNADDEIKKIM